MSAPQPANALRRVNEQSGSALTVFVYNGEHCVPSVWLPEPAVHYSGGGVHDAMVTAQGNIFSRGGHTWRPLGVGDSDPRLGFVAVRLPWPAAAVSCGGLHFAAVRRGGTAVCSWGAFGPWLGHDGNGSLPAAVQGLPQGDPVVILEAGGVSVIAVTQSGDAYGWGYNEHGALAIPLGLADVPAPQRIAALSGRGLRRLALGKAVVSFAVAETSAGELLVWGVLPVQAGAPAGVPQPPQQLQPRAGRLVFPLRSVAVGNCAAAVDGAGQLWCLWQGQGTLASAELPSAERIIRAAVTTRTRCEPMVVALTDEGCLWECSMAAPCRSITAAHPELPLWLLPCSSMNSACGVPLIADACGGKPRLRLFARIAVRMRLPSDPLRVILTPLVVCQEFITGPADEPFSWPARPRAEAQ